MPVSDSISTQNALLDMENTLIDQGVQTVLGGEYANTFGVDHLKMVPMS